MRALHADGYLADPHSALAWSALGRSLRPGEEGVFLVRHKEVLSSFIPGEFAALRHELGF